MKTPFFKIGREDFFRPVTGPWREVVVQTVVAMYDCFHGDGRRGAYFVDRSDLKDMAINTIEDFPVLAGESEESDPVLGNLKDEASKANEIIRRLREHGWIETFEDPGTHREVYRFTRVGKNAAQWLAEQDSPALRMTQRNVRNTKYSLQAYLRDGDAYDLFMALDHSKRITSDLADDIAEIHEKRRAIVAESIQEIALLDYVQYMSGKFAPVTAVKLRADSVYRHERDIRDVILQIESQPAEMLKDLERAARVFRNEETPEGSVILRTLREIMMNLRDAMDTKMQELAAAVSEYTDRTSFLALQASVITSTGSANSLNRVLDCVAALKDARQDGLLASISKRLSPYCVALVDESMLKLRKASPRAKVETVHNVRVPTRAERLAAYLQEEEDKAFTVSVKDIRESLHARLASSERGELLLSEIEVHTYDDFLELSHSLEAAANAEFGKQQLVVRPLGVRRSNAYIEFDEFAIRQARKGEASNG
jgi:hypothetical protein